MNRRYEVKIIPVEYATEPLNCEGSSVMSEKKDFETIMKGITGGLTGDPESDLKYLDKQVKKYKDHEYGKEIARACGRLMYQLIPEEKKAELKKAIEKDGMGFDAALEEIRFNIFKKDYDTALKLMEGMIRKYEELDLYSNDSVSEYFCFREPMEEILYTQYNEPKKDIRNAQVDYGEMYLQYGSLLVDMGRIEDAAAALEKAKRWDPANAKTAFEYIETFKMRGMTEDFGKLTREVFRYAFRPADLARCYRNMAYYFVEIKEYKAAVCCLLFSDQFEKSEMVSSELYYIIQQTGETYRPTNDEVVECFKKNDIPLGPAEDVLKIAYAYGMHFHEKGDDAGTAYFLKIIAGFVDSKEINEILEGIGAKGTER